MEFEIRHIIKKTLTREEFFAWQKVVGVDKKKFVNTNGKKYKRLGLKSVIDDMSEE